MVQFLTPKFWQKSNFLSDMMLPFSWFYEALSLINKLTSKPYKSKATIICIGNVIAGGSGKTPVAIAVSRTLENKKFCFIASGYKANIKNAILVNPKHHPAKLVGDEALLLAKHAPTIVGPNRVDAIKFAETKGFDFIICDDGLQSPKFYKDIKILVIDSHIKFGNRRIIPSGPLRCRLSFINEKNIDAIIIVGNDPIKIDHKHIFLTQVKPINNKFANQRILAFAGIAYPEKFFRTLAENNIIISDKVAFPDHYKYKTKDLENLNSKAKKLGAILLTTEKDYVRLSGMYKNIVKAFHVEVIFKNEVGFKSFLKSKIVNDSKKILTDNIKDQKRADG